MAAGDTSSEAPRTTLRALAIRHLLLIALLPVLLLAVSFALLETRRLGANEAERVAVAARLLAADTVRQVESLERAVRQAAAAIGAAGCAVPACLEPELERLRGLDPALVSALAADAGGRVLASSRARGESPVELIAHDAFRRLAGGERGPLRSAAGAGHGPDAAPLLAIAAALRAADGAFLGMLEVEIEPGAGGVLSPEIIAPGRQLLLLDSSDRVLAAVPGAPPRGQTAPASLLAALSGGHERDADGARWIVAAAPVGELGWRAVARGRVAGAYRTLGPYLLALAVLIGLAALGLWLIARRAASALAAPMEQVVIELERIDPEQPEASSGLAQRVRVKTLELARIGEALDALLGRLARSKAAQIDALNATEEANLKLAAIIDERERHIEEQTAQLRKALSDAQDAARAKDQLLANTSHEIRTPLNGVIGTAELLLRRELAPADKHAVETILRCAEGLLQLINDILDLTRLRNDTLALGRERFDLRAEITSVVDALKPMAEQRGLALESRFDPALVPGRMGDPLRLRQVLLNLVSNAVKFTEHGYVRVSVAPRDGDLVRLTVEDTGIGIRPEHIERIFEPFVQVDSTMSRWSQGTGLGLTISRQLVALMGGTLSVESTFGQGSKFTILLPLEIAVEEAAPAPAPASSSGDEQRLARYRMLVVDDVELNRDVLVSQLATLGIQADGVEDGFEALEYLLTHPCDVVLLDCQMPGMDGYEVSRRIRKRWPGRRLHVIAVTAHAMPSERQRCLDAGMDEYLAKPVRLKALREVLERVVLGAEVPPAS